jgi:hypothetical protein
MRNGNTFFSYPIVVMSTNVDEINLSELYKQKAKKNQNGNSPRFIKISKQQDSICLSLLMEKVAKSAW